MQQAKDSIFKTIIVLILLFPSQVLSDTYVLDQLFNDLKNATSETEARTIEDKIWKEWMQSGDAEVDALMQQALRKRSEYNFNGTLLILNKIIQIKPSYAEAWNQRATLYFYQESYEKSLSDIAETLKREPRHFGALSGRAVIRLRQLKPALARQNILEALKIHPFIREISLFPGLQKT